MSGPWNQSGRNSRCWSRRRSDGRLVAWALRSTDSTEASREASSSGRYTARSPASQSGSHRSSRSSNSWSWTSGEESGTTAGS